MFNLNVEKIQETKISVERLHRRYSKYDSLSKDQVVSKILDDLDTKFCEDPSTEVAAIMWLAVLNQDNKDILNYLKEEYLLWAEDYKTEINMYNLDIEDLVGGVFKKGSIVEVV